MSEKSIKDTVIELIARKFGIGLSDVKPGSRFKKDLGANSLDMIDLVMALEEELDVEIDDAEAAKIKTVDQLVDYVEKHQPVQ